VADTTDYNNLKKKYASLESEVTDCITIKEILPLYRAMVEHASEAILVARRNEIVFANPRAVELFERSEQDLIGHTLESYILIEDRPLLLSKYATAIENDGRIQISPIRVVDLSGGIKWVNINISRFTGHSEPVVFYFMTDITQRKLAEDRLRRSEEKYRRVIDSTSGGYILMDKNFLIIDVNQSFLKMLGLQRDDILGKPPDSLYDSHSVVFYSADRDHFSFEARFSVKQGGDIPLLYNRSTLRTDQGVINGYVAFLSDLTELKIVQERLGRAEERYRRMYENAVQGMFQSTFSGRLLRANPSFARILGFESPGEVLAHKSEFSTLQFNPSDRQKFFEALKLEGMLSNYEVKLKRRDGQTIWLLFNVRLTDGYGSEPLIEGIVVDNTAKKLAEEELRKSEEKFRRLSIHDNLTGLYNTRYLYKALADLIFESETSGIPFSLIFLDMDNFKSVVDTYGHLNGSRALQEVAATIKSALIEPAFGVAYGGDEFVVVLPGSDKSQALEKTKDIQSLIREKIYLEEQGHHVHLKASFGVATFPEDAADYSELLSLADKAMFAIKKRGKNAIGVNRDDA
jgi:diguanylate cyclase (GGDEF)-like protein/PAS domain S-box-containing protein